MKSFRDWFVMHIRWNITGLLILALILISIISAPAIKHQLNSWKLLPQPERLTELYFTNPNNLPTTYTPGQNQTVSFTVHNLEYRTTTYNYAINEVNQDGSVTQPLISDSFTIDQNQFKQVATAVTPIDMGSRVKISVELKTKNQAIDYLVTKAGL